MDKKTDAKDFRNVIAALAACYRVETDTALFEGYWMALDDLPLDGVKAAAVSAMRTSRFMPTAVELRELAGGMQSRDRAIMAWQAFETAVRHVGAYKSIEFDDPVLTATVRNLGGWMRLCEMPTEEFDKWLRKDFERVYVSLASQGVTPEQASPLLGIYDKENGGNGFELSKPVKYVTGLPVNPGALRLPNEFTPRLKGIE